MTMPRDLFETEISDGRGGTRLVRPGDSVELLPANPDDEYQEVKGIYLTEANHRFLQNWLGEGAYIIASIGKWPCGRVMLYVKTSTSSGAGAYATDFKYHG